MEKDALVREGCAWQRSGECNLACSLGSAFYKNRPANDPPFGANDPPFGPTQACTFSGGGRFVTISEIASGGELFKLHPELKANMLAQLKNKKHNTQEGFKVRELNAKAIVYQATCWLPPPARTQP